MKPASSTRVARNFIRNRGKKSFRSLLLALENQQSGQVIADQFGVSRERVRQWRNQFGQTISMYRVHADVDALRQGPG